MDDLITFLRARLKEQHAEAEARARNPYADMSDDELHQHRLHPAYEYRTTEGQRKAWEDADTPPPGEGWELNITSVDPEAWERFDYTEERYWRRLLPEGQREWKPPADVVWPLADIEAKRQILDLVTDAGPMFGDGYTEAYRDVVRLLALPDASHPDYREEWRP